jgi:hypothetical protein
MSDINETEFDVAIDTMAYMIGRKSNEFLHEKNSELKSQLSKELDALYEERQLMYRGDKEILKKIKNVYSPEIKKNFERS